MKMKLRFLACVCVLLSLQNLHSENNVIWAVGKDGPNKGNVWFKEGIDSSHEWVNISGHLKKIVANNKSVYGLDYNGSIWRRTGVAIHNPTGTGWEKMKNLAGVKHVSINDNNQLIAVLKNNKVFMRYGIEKQNLHGSRWVRLPYEFSFMWATNNVAPPREYLLGMLKDGSMAMRNDQLQSPTWKTTNTWFSTVPFKTIKSFATNNKGIAWTVTKENDVYYRHNLTNNYKWEKIKSVGVFTQVEVDNHNHVWALNKQGDLFYRDGISSDHPAGLDWKQVPGLFKQIAINDDSHIWGIDNKNDIYFRMGITKDNPFGKTWKRIHGKLAKIAINSNNQIWGIGTNNKVFCRLGTTEHSPTGTLWKEVPGNAKHIYVGTHGDIWTISMNNHIFVRRGISDISPSGYKWEKVYKKPIGKLFISTLDPIKLFAA